MKGEKNKKQHFVPQCYLKNFSLNRKSLWVYNKSKNNNNIYQQSVSNICCKDDFYSLTEICREKLFLEKDYFANDIEPLLSNKLKHIIEKGSEYIINKVSSEIFTSDEKYEFAYLLAIQWFRTPYQKKTIYNLSNDVSCKMIRLFQEGLAIEKGNDNYRKLNIKPCINPVIEHAERGYMNNDLLESYAKALADNYWEFYITPQNNVYTSDFPITVKKHCVEAQNTFEGLACFGSEMTYPISKNICLTIWDKDFFQDKKSKDLKFSDMSESDLIHFNLMRYIYSNELYCSENDFSFIELLPKLCGKELGTPSIKDNR